MSEAALFSIFHRAHSPAPPAPEPVPAAPDQEPVVAPPAVETAQPAAAVEIAQPAVAVETAQPAATEHSSASVTVAEHPEPAPEPAPDLAPSVPTAPVVVALPVQAAEPVHAPEVPAAPEQREPATPDTSVEASAAVQEPAATIVEAAPSDLLAPDLGAPGTPDIAPTHWDLIPAVEETAPEPILAAHDTPPAATLAEPHGPAAFPVEADQLGLAHPAVITLHARLMDGAPTELDASQSGLYRPHGFRPAPWSGFAYDQAEDGRTGLAAGTRILTSRGEIPVERLLPGDTALTLRSPALLPIAWIGRSTATAELVQIEVGAIGPDLPRHKLQLAPDQLVYVDPVPVPAGQLVNGSSVRFVDGPPTELFHVDVGKSDILFAEGLALCSSDRARLRLAS